jgi:hypothetical protein
LLSTGCMLFLPRNLQSMYLSIRSFLLSLLNWMQTTPHLPLDWVQSLK